MFTRLMSTLKQECPRIGEGITVLCIWNYAQTMFSSLLCSLSSSIWIILCKGPPVAISPWIAFPNTMARSTPGDAAVAWPAKATQDPAMTKNKHDLVHH